MLDLPPHLDGAPQGGSSSVVILDGGLSNALEDRGHDLSGHLWTARLLRDEPDEIAAVHRSYYRAGARVATTASYQASIDGLMSTGIGRHEAEALIVRSVLLAREVRDEMSADGVPRWVAASVGPYGAVLADGSEYRGRYGLTAAALRDFHLPRLELLASAGPDLLAVETIPDIDEATVLVDLLGELNLPAWFSFTVRGLRTAAGQPLRDALALAGSIPQTFAVGVNCCSPDDVFDAVLLATEITGRPAVAYPNSGGKWNAAIRSWHRMPAFEPALARGWVQAGARYVGGCCRVGSDTITGLAQLLTEE